MRRESVVYMIAEGKQIYGAKALTITLSPDGAYDIKAIRDNLQ